MAGDMTFVIDFQGKTENLAASYDAITAQMKSKPLIIPMQADTSGVAGTAGAGADQVVNAEAMVALINEQAVGLQKVVANTVLVTDSNTEEAQTYRVATDIVLTYTDGMGQTYKVKQQLISADELEANGLQKVAGSQAQYIQNNQTISNSLASVQQKTENIIQSTNEWMAKAQTMSGPQVDAAKKAGAAIQDLGVQYKAAMAAEDDAKALGFANAIVQQSSAFNTLTEATTRSAGSVRSWGDNITNAIKQTISYSLSIGLVRDAQKLLSDAMKYVIDLNTQMVQIQELQRQGMQTPDEINALAVSYNNLADSLGSTTLAIAQASVGWLKQGYTAEQTTQLVTASAQLAKLGVMDENTATSLLTSTLNSFGMKVEDVSSVMDKFTTVASKTNTTVNGLSSAIRYSGAEASQVGVSFDQLVSYIATVSNVTQLTAEQVGQSMKTMLARMTTLKSGSTDAGVSINNVDKALKTIGVSMTDASGNFRDMGAVMQDIAGQWDGLNQKQQDYIASQVAGLRQVAMFRALMENMGTALKLQSDEATSAGAAQEKYAFYLQSVEAAQNKLTTAMQALYQSAIASGTITFFINLATSIVKVITEFGGLNVIVPTVLAILAVSKWSAIAGAINTVGMGISGLITWFKGLATAATAAGAAEALAAPEVYVIIGLVALAAAGIAYFTGEVQRNQKAFEDATAAMKASGDELTRLNDEAKNVKSLADIYGTLKDKVGKTTDEQNQLNDAMNQLHQLFPELTGAYDDNYNFILDTKIAEQDILDIEKQRLVIAQQQEEAAAKTALETGVKTLNDKEAALATAKATLDNKKAELARTLIAYTDTDKFSYIIDQAKQGYAVAEAAYNKAQDDVKSLHDEFVSFYSTLGADEKKALITTLDPTGTNEILKQWMAEADKTITANALKAWAIATENYYKGLDAQRAALSTPEYQAGQEAKVAADLKTLADLKTKLATSAPIFSQADLTALSAAGIELENINGKWQITSDSMKAFIKQEEDVVAQLRVVNPGLADTVQRLIDIAMAGSSTIPTLDELANATKDLSAAESEQQKNGFIEAETAYQLLQTYPELTGAIYELNGVYYINVERAKQVLKATLEEELKLYDLSDALKTAADGSLALAVSQAQIANATPEVIAKLRAEIVDINNFGEVSSTASNTSALDAAKNAAQDEYNARIKAAEAEKADLAQKLKDYQKIIDARKAILKSMHDEADYQATLAAASTSVADVQNKLLAISLDNSEEAKAQRLTLEQDLAKDKTDLAKTEADHAYQAQIDALDKEAAAYKDMIDMETAALDTFIQKLKDALQAIVDKIDAQKTADKTVKTPPPQPAVTVSPTPNATYSSINPQHPGGYNPTPSANPIAYPRRLAVPVAEGGLVTGGIPGTDSVNSMLMPGEFVMKKSIVDSIGASALDNINKGGGMGDINISMPVTVQGNLDETVLPDIEQIVNKAFQAMNQSLYKRGYKRTANVYST